MLGFIPYKDGFNFDMKKTSIHIEFMEDVDQYGFPSLVMDELVIDLGKSKISLKKNYMLGSILQELIKIAEVVSTHSIAFFGSHMVDLVADEVLFDRFGNWRVPFNFTFLD